MEDEKLPDQSRTGADWLRVISGATVFVGVCGCFSKRPRKSGIRANASDVSRRAAAVPGLIYPSATALLSQGTHGSAGSVAVRLQLTHQLSV